LQNKRAEKIKQNYTQSKNQSKLIMALKKFRPKSKKSMKKRIKVSNGGDLNSGKLIVKRKNMNHRLIRRRSSVKIKSHTETVLPETFKAIRAVI
jgi:hypothetical protein